MNQIKTLLIAAFAGMAFSASAQWTEVEWAQTDGLHFIDFVDDETGYARMEMLQGFTSSFEKTTDGGQTWTELNLPVEAYDIQDMDFMESGEGVLATRTFAGGETMTQVYRTLDDGATWENITPPDAANGYGLAQIQLLDETSIFFVTDDYFYRTIDGGDTWITTLLPKAAVSVNFFDADHGVVGTWDGTFLYGGSMLATTDGGETWNETVLDIAYTVIGAVHQFNETTAYAAPVKWGANGQLEFYKTINNGLEWTSVALPETTDGATLTGFDFRDENYGVVTLSSNDQFYIYNTTDGGETWTLQNQLDQLYITDVSLTSNSGYISGEGGLMLRLNAPLGLHESEAITVSVYPNPVSSGQIIRWDATEKFTQIEIVDSTGKEVFRQNLTVQNMTLPDLNSAVYFVSLRNESIAKTIKIVIE